MNIQALSRRWPRRRLQLRLPLPKLLLAIYAAVLAVFQHRANIKRLSEGTEPDFKAADSK